MEYLTLDANSIFQSTLPHGERHDAGIGGPREELISIHAPAWGATAEPDACGGIEQFQSTLPHGERRRSARIRRACRYFNPRSRMGSDYIPYRLVLPISYFNPRSRMGSDPTPRNPRPRCTNFNPRSRMGSDQIIEVVADVVGISIHAPAWGATCPTLWFRPIPMLFQSTLPHGERPAWSGFTTSPVTFQSTLPHGERPDLKRRSEEGVIFQSTLPHGERPG